ncbi:MAG: DNA mismatch repair endonuclease MutL [Acidobacteria bacterium]|jgi:DNA mismatch repair protein MutL|nr:DNA mismatch repair endonuclease MutL [Acidobacteriota bacterium]
MGLVRVLPPDVADRIAAGEVVERPASVLRELLDNALDAGSTRVEIELAGGGRDLVSVADDGCGLDPDDALLAFERHATSKIRSGEDLESVRTLGFRGEALAAIAAVSRVEMLTCPGAGSEGTRVRIDRGRLLGVERASRAPGTTIQVWDLFLGIPARRKFLKSPETELDHCLRVVTRAALARPEVGFWVRHGGRTLVSAPSAGEPAGRVADLLGSRLATGLLPVEGDGGRLAVSGWAGRSDLHRPTRDDIHLFVNRRPVRDPLLVRAVLDAYRPGLPGGRFPVSVLFVELPPEDVDVNVHPAKSEVRFSRPQEVRALLFGAIGRALRGRAAVPALAQPPVGLSGGGPAAGPGAIPGATSPPAVRDGASPRGLDGAAPPSPGRLAWDDADGPPARPLAQFANCYIVAADERGLLVVDQHVAHERMIYERLIAEAESGPMARQLLLFPQTVELPPGGIETLERERGSFERIGFRFEPFGGRTVMVREVPAVLGREARPAALEDLVARAMEGDRSGAEALFPRLLATVACHSAVRKGMPLSLEQMGYILRGLAACEVPGHCPHGRVISLRVDLGALDRGFDRA